MQQALYAQRFITYAAAKLTYCRHKCLIFVEHIAYYMIVAMLHDTAYCSLFTKTMELLYLDKLPKGFGRNKILRLLIEEGQFNKLRIGKIVVTGKRATIELDSGDAAQVAQRLDGLQLGTSKIRAWHELTAEDTDDHFARLLRWLALEAKAEQQQVTSGKVAAESSIGRLVMVGQEVGLGGRIVVQLAPRDQHKGLPFTRLGSGSPVLVVEEGGKQGVNWRGVITQIRKGMVEVALTQWPEPENDDATFRVQLSSDAIARERMERALAQVAAARGNRLAELRDVILGKERALFRRGDKERGRQGGALSLSKGEDGLNRLQREAVELALSAEDIAIIHGPPGTGKTTTLVAVIEAAVVRGETVLACAPSNMAVDNLAESLTAVGASIVRIGHPARVLEQLQDYTLDAQVEQHEDYKLAKRLRRQAYGLQNDAVKWRRAKPLPGEKAAMRQEAKQLQAEARSLEARAVERVLDSVPIVLSTLTALDSSLLGQRQFDLCVIDEAGQSTEPATWIPVTRARRVVLAGDHLQLPPTVISQQAQDEGFGVSLLERMMNDDLRMKNEAEIAVMLEVQYRMHGAIMGFSSAEFYANSLVADLSVANHLLSDLPHIAEADSTTTPVTYIDTAGASYDERREVDGRSWENPEEANLIVRKVNELIAAGVQPAEIGVITPYSAQVRLIRERVQHDVEVNSVDGFQGREKEVILMSLVRSNERGEVGFLSETRRMNVALTRARRRLIVVGDSGTISAEPFFARLLDYWDGIGAYKSVWEEGI